MALFSMSEFAERKTAMQFWLPRTSKIQWIFVHSESNSLVSLIRTDDKGVGVFAVLTYPH